MRSGSTKARRLALTITAVALACAALAPPAMAKVSVSFQRIAGVESAGTPAKYNKVGILKVGSKKARNVLVLNPGTSASAAYFAPLAKERLANVKGWQVLGGRAAREPVEDHSVLDPASRTDGSSEGTVRLLSRVRQRPERGQALPAHLPTTRSATPTTGA